MRDDRTVVPSFGEDAAELLDALALAEIDARLVDLGDRGLLEGQRAAGLVVEIVHVAGDIEAVEGRDILEAPVRIERLGQTAKQPARAAEPLPSAIAAAARTGATRRKSVRIVGLSCRSSADAAPAPMRAGVSRPDHCGGDRRASASADRRSAEPAWTEVDGGSLDRARRDRIRATPSVSATISSIGV